MRFKRALNKVAAWRRYIEHRLIEGGHVRPKGQKGAWDYKTFDNSKLGECTVYSGKSIPVHPTYLTVEVHIKMVADANNLDAAALSSFRRFVYTRLRTEHSLYAKKIGKANALMGLQLLESLA